MNKYKFRIWTRGVDIREFFDYPTHLVFDTLEEAKKNIPFNMVKRPTMHSIHSFAKQTRDFYICMEKEDRSRIWYVEEHPFSSYCVNNTTPFCIDKCFECIETEKSKHSICTCCKGERFTEITDKRKNEEIVDIFNLNKIYMTMPC